METTPFGAFEYFPTNLEWLTQMLRLFSYCYVRGADFSEVHAVARGLPVGDDAAWQRGFSELADRIEASAHASAAGGHDISRNDRSRRAQPHRYRMRHEDEKSASAILMRILQSMR